MKWKIAIIAFVILFFAILLLFTSSSNRIDFLFVMAAFFVIAIIGISLAFILYVFIRTVFTTSIFSLKTQKLSFFFYIGAFIFTIIAPITGIYYNQMFPDYFLFSSDNFRPVISHNYAYIIYAMSFLAVVCYWLSLISFKKFSPIGKFVLNMGILQGIILATILIIQTFPTSYRFLVFLPLTFPLLSPFICLLLGIIQLKRNHHVYTLESKKSRKKKTSDIGWTFILLFPYYIIVESITVLLYQKPDAIILAFTETCSWTLSQYPCNYANPSHYLCTVAAKGHPKLVKPLRKGIRQNSIILVNRQLLIANALKIGLKKKCPKYIELFEKYTTKWAFQSQN